MIAAAEGPQLPKILYKIVQSSKYCKIVMKDCNLTYAAVIHYT